MINFVKCFGHVYVDRINLVVVEEGRELLRLEEGQQVVQKHVQELFANVMDFELQSRGEPCYLHDQGNIIKTEKKPKAQWIYDLKRSINRSTHPGFKYLTEVGSPAVRLFWVIALMVVLVVCGISVFISYCHWSSGYSSGYTTNQVSLGSIPFPAITICPERNIGAKFQLNELLKLCTSYTCSRDQFEQISAASFLCPSLLETTSLKYWSSYYNSTSPEFMLELMPSCSEDIPSYHWAEKGTDTNCTKSFQTLYIDDRVCYTYNMLPASYVFKDKVSPEPVMMDATGLMVRPGWTPDSLVRPDYTDHSIPIHRDWAGEDFKLIINLDRKIFNQSSCVDPFKTFQVAVHHPADIPIRSSHRYLHLPVVHSLHIAVTPVIESSPLECLVPLQGDSKLFRHYSQAKCRLECRVRCSTNMCGCVPLYLPRAGNTTKWCGVQMRHCTDSLVPELLRGEITWKSITKHFRMWIRKDLKETITSHLYDNPGQEELTDKLVDSLRPDCTCDCPPACRTVQYHLDTQVVPRGSQERNWKNKSEINVYFKEGIEAVTLAEPKVMNYFVDFLAHVGGLMALFTGISVLSVLELLYLTFSAMLRRGRQDNGYVSRQTSCLRQKQEWDKTAQTDPIFITDGHLNIAF
ncbi:pickpocket protein 28-like [Macrosteles quadrilineatus]|uniref:pickpocket protein 28-like n=1 Tax=Macrosteles quadrilineatus TaxID=74068 RepID=UPI0023E2DF30|nr:pickpocket protein 28-like [Macrosteles quadrilineatus]